ncbi:VOC family protein [Variovorax sp. PAMC 28711]|uniref:VOC family protein n=1 Tax=Variovorax sp. PAMC 28711 TaxID=1795631 RepID=UPI00078E13BF|nr:VOC family protein [Variovorax sp. PAMC 28711]AMM25940.1 hypothetical protein AX767_17430 [Variovorax sp. PAMC 28711]
MWPALDRPTLQGVQLAVPDLDAAVAFAEQVLRLERTAPDAACFRLGAQWLAFVQHPSAASAGNVATLHWRCSDLRRQRTLLTQLGFDSQGDSEPDDVTPLRVVAADTGACALQWVADNERKTNERPPSSSSPGITALVLHARAPERVAAHWAQIFQVSVERHAAGLPRLVLDGISLQFVFVEEGAGGVGRITLALDDAGAVRERAIACGTTVDGDALTLPGLTIGLPGA